MRKCERMGKEKLRERKRKKGTTFRFNFFSFFLFFQRFGLVHIDYVTQVRTPKVLYLSLSLSPFSSLNFLFPSSLGVRNIFH